MESSARSGDGTGTGKGASLILLDSGTLPWDIYLAESYNFSDSPTDEDVYGHGVHLNNTAAAKDNNKGIVGIAPGARTVNVKVLNDDGISDISNVVAGLEAVMEAKAVNPGHPMVVNLSLGADTGTTDYSSLDIAVDAAVASGITVVVSAGNDGMDASTVTPAHAAGAITVGAYDEKNRFAGFSNYGPAVDLLAPGVDILSVGLDTKGRKTGVWLTGTSMAAAHVAGAAVLFLSQYKKATPAQVRKYLLSAAKADITSVPANTTNKTVWVGDF